MSEVAERGWVVQLGLCVVPFASHQEAGQFVERLQQRLSAPHPLPLEGATPSSAGHEAVTQRAEHAS
ncbi:hypothetical protein HNE05_09935 [Aquipseudomonas campi]|uniref:Uncharacterized protein n=1 Tax=Aquipseudomonas campi TaxID=2731681 RepID=A0A6M8FCN5_9GAMM|nr:hypothetical protein [Pseudomonas campi]QKE61819.1 hypothetical protein HNE05_09935 [Pseudomonas campi]